LPVVDSDIYVCIFHK